MTAAISTDLSGHVATETAWRAELSLQTIGSALHATLIREDTTWYDDDPHGDITEEVVCERDLVGVPLPAAFAAVDEWLVGEHRLRVLPHSWVPCDSGGDTGVALLLEGRVLPARPIDPLSNWGS
ncbi:hypothetical protein [[Mycobacterium] vasticus]|uniref:Uncharacterized protein n=1 Tax=[Mycobacterium] vasticus TaxID=2875777 RepID=A0ABU5Z3H1_9MYCO|nr:hypothetical protein [Mycolicibacter sp. MYC017]MEB3071952.1 hypothetical protein [Mycolicibacter sp. MYC017]